MQENRKLFLPTLWTIPSGGLKPGQVLKQVRSSLLSSTPPSANPIQVWFAGAHADVGGGYERHELADIALYWMAASSSSMVRRSM